jgi:hypothetical protein
VTDWPGSKAETVPVTLIVFVVVWFPPGSVDRVWVSVFTCPSGVIERTVTRVTVAGPFGEGSVLRETTRPTSTSAGTGPS